MSRRQLALSLLGLALVLPAARLLPDQNALALGLRLVAGTFAVGVLPGVALVLAALPIRRLGFLQLLGLGMAVSFGLTQVMTILALLAHLPADAVCLALWVLSAGGLCLAWRRADPQAEFAVEAPELLLAGLIAILAFALYLGGSPYSATAGEDGINIAVIRRLAFLPRPSIGNIYWAPGIVYTYPFPATHYFFALISRASGADPFFVYLKMRFFWVIPAITFVHLGARLVFGSPRLAFLTSLAAALFACNGSFGKVGLYAWAQLVPLSHASDIAMTVYLPGLLVLSLGFLFAQGRGQQLFYFLAAASLVLLLTIVHIREIVQYVVYLTSFLTALLLVRRERALLLRTAALLVVTLGIVAIYMAWHKQTVGHVDAFVQDRKHTLVELAGAMRWKDWIARPFTSPYFVCAENLFFVSWFPLLLLAAPALCWLYRRNPLVLLVGSSILAYLLIVRLPLLTVPYVYLTYFEILYTPVRNVVFFLYLLTGAFFYVLALSLAQIRSWPVRLLAAGLVTAGIGCFYHRVGQWLWPPQCAALTLGSRADVFLLVVLAALAVALVCFAVRRGGIWSQRLHPEEAPAGWKLIFALMVGGLALWCRGTAGSPLRVQQISAPNLTRALLALPELCESDQPFPYNPADPERMGLHPDIKVKAARSCPPSPALVAWANRHLPASSVLAINLLNKYSPAPFLMQQIAYWPHLDCSTGSYFRRIFPRYYQLLERSLARYRDQPFFNAGESLEERLAFVRELGITHILVDPMCHEEMGQALARWPEQFARVFDDGRWVVFAVTPPAVEEAKAE